MNLLRIFLFDIIRCCGRQNWAANCIHCPFMNGIASAGILKTVHHFWSYLCHLSSAHLDVINIKYAQEYFFFIQKLHKWLLDQGCRECLESTGGEGGWHECRWSTALGQCVAPSYQPLQCIGGMCGAILQGSAASACPRPCSQFTQCSTCHQQPHCGWCSLDSAPVSGIGLCTSGTLEGPLDGSCSALDYTRVLDRLVLNGTQTRKGASSKLPSVSLIDKTTSGHYQSCPPENECITGHHTCDPQSERCVDRDDGFACICSDGYVYDASASVCRPVCSQGCVHGDCQEPNVCRCHFGFVGSNCSIQCKCNGHSECAGPDQLDVCLDCNYFSIHFKLLYNSWNSIF